MKSRTGGNGQRLELFVARLRFSRLEPYVFMRRSVGYMGLIVAVMAVVYVTLGWMGG